MPIDMVLFRNFKEAFETDNNKHGHIIIYKLCLTVNGLKFWMNAKRPNIIVQIDPPPFFVKIVLDFVKRVF